MDAQSQNMMHYREEAASNVQAANGNNENARDKNSQQKKKYHKNAIYAARMSREPVGYVRPHNHTGLDL